MPKLGYGVYQVDAAETERCVADAIRVGYRSIDTAQAYTNEEGVGEAVAKSGVPREELFITTKVWISNAGQEKAAASIDASLRKLKTDYIDLLLIHQPFNDYYGTYRAMEEAYKAGKVRAIGVSNFYRTGSLTCANSWKWFRRSTRWRPMCSSSRPRPMKSWKNTASGMSPGARLPRGERISSTIPC